MRPEGAAWQEERKDPLLRKKKTGPVLIFGGNPVVGQALKLLLGSVGCDARYLPRLGSDEPDVLEGVQLLLFAGRVGAEQPEASAQLENAAVMAEIPILELVSSTEETQAGNKRFVLWPCPIEELKRRIDAALLGGYRSKEGRDESYD